MRDPGTRYQLGKKLRNVWKILFSNMAVFSSNMRSISKWTEIAQFLGHSIINK